MCATSFMGSVEQGTPAGNPFDRQWGPHLAEGKHQFTVNWNSIPIADLLYRHDRHDRPIGHAIHADDRRRRQRRRLLERSRVHLRSLEHGRHGLAASMRSLLAGGAPAARECLSKQLQHLAARATCQSPWVTTANLRVSLNPQKMRLPKRANIALNFTNPLAIADLDRARQQQHARLGAGHSARPEPAVRARLRSGDEAVQVLGERSIRLDATAAVGVALGGVRQHQRQL